MFKLGFESFDAPTHGPNSLEAEHLAGASESQAAIESGGEGDSEGFDFETEVAEEGIVETGMEDVDKDLWKATANAANIE